MLLGLRCALLVARSVMVNVCCLFGCCPVVVWLLFVCFCLCHACCLFVGVCCVSLVLRCVSVCVVRRLLCVVACCGWLLLLFFLGGGGVVVSCLVSFIARCWLSFVVCYVSPFGVSY